MKLAIRAFALTVVLAGAAAAAVSSSSTKHVVVPSRPVAMDGLPVPACSPLIPTCPTGGKKGK